jgi:alpha-1,3-rhamnosyltransferase
VDVLRPLVSVPVITYNSSKTVVETLDSIYNQIYPNLELIVSDDCSTDNTVEICRDWIEVHKDRFARTKLLTVEKNTGVSANCNRAEAACRGEWVKEIAGDDMLLPNCVGDYVDYVKVKPEAIYVFGKMKFFGTTDGNYSQYEKIFDYSFFSLSSQEQLHKLIFERNYIPAATAFYNIRKLRDMNLNGNDERIPMLEDFPKWIRLLQNGMTFHFLDKEVVCYRVNTGISTAKCLSLEYFMSNIRFDLLYRYPIWIKENNEEEVERIVDFICEQYRARVEFEEEVERLHNTSAYRLGKFLLRPFSWIKKKK